MAQSAGLADQQPRVELGRRQVGRLQLRGKVPALVGLSVGGAALLAYLGWLPGFRRPRA